MPEILKERSELDPQFQWDLTPMFESDAAWETALDSLDADIESLAAFAGKLTDAVTIGAYLDASTEVGRKVERLYCYASQRHDEDTRDDKAQSMYARIGSKYVKMAAALSFAQPEILSLPEETLTAEEDYTAVYNADGTVSIVLIEGGKANGATNLTVSGKKVDASKVTAADIVGGVDAATGAETGLEVVRQVYPKLGMTPGILTAPRFSTNATVSAALQAKTKEINGVFKCVCIADVDSSADGARKYADVKEQKERQALTDPNAYGVWGYGKVGDVMYSGSALASALTAYTDAASDDIPSNPSNKTIAISAMCLADGTEVLLDQDQANVVNSYGVATWLNMNGFRLWGNRTCAYPGNTDPKDSFFSCRRYMSWRANSFILTYFQKVDSPLNKRLIEAIVDSENVRGNGYVAMGVAARDEIVYNEDENPVTDLMNGKITFHQYMTPYTPAEDIEDIIEFDPDALVSALS